MSEFSSARSKLSPFLTGYGLDLGFGGFEPSMPNAICIDREPGTGSRPSVAMLWPTHLAWDIFTRLPFVDNVFDYVASSHALEDAVDTAWVLREWNRVLKPGGNLVLFLPDQKTYEAHCQLNGSVPNADHKHRDFSLEFVKRHLPRNCRVVESIWPFPGNPYSFALVLRKTA